MGKQPEIEILEIVGLDENNLESPAMPDMALERGKARRTGRADGVRDVLRELLPALDGLEQCVRQQPGPEALEAGVKLALRELLNAFRRYELERIEGDGMSFDPRLHEAAMVTPSDRVEPGTVLETMRVGYLLAGELVRPAMVRVSGEPENIKDASREVRADEPACI